jgi:hypothetical protein
MTTLPTTPHLSAIRETALAIKHTAAFALAFHDKELARDRSGRSGLHRDGLAEMKVLGDVAGKGLSEVRGCVGRLKEGLGEGGWLDRVLDVVFPFSAEGGSSLEGDEVVGVAVEEVVGGRGVAEEWAGRVVESWREGVKGWGMVRLE